VHQLEQPWAIAYRKQGGFYQSDFIPEHRAFYVAYNRCREAPDLPMAQFVEFVMSKCDELDAHRIIIDLRFNGGGDETVIWPLWQALEQSERFRDPGDIIGLISRQTFSSAMSNSHQLRDNCGAILIGEPTGGKPNHFGQLSRFELPHSGLTISHSTRWFQKVEGDPDAVHPDVLILWRSVPTFAGQDPVMEAALNYVHPTGED
jgi:C-terminal processing protease CtpA/Prc